MLDQTQSKRIIEIEERLEVLGEIYSNTQDKEHLEAIWKVMKYLIKEKGLLAKEFYG